MMVSLLEDNSLGDTSLNPYLQILNNGDGFGQSLLGNDMGNITIEHVDISKISTDDFVLDENFFLSEDNKFDIGIEAGDVNSLLEQFEESEATHACSDDAAPVQHHILQVPVSPANNNLCKKNADAALKKASKEQFTTMSIEEIAKKIVPVKRKSTILLENMTLPLKRNRKPQNNVAVKTVNCQSSSLPCSHPNSLPNSAPNSLPASLPSSCNSSRSCSPVHQWNVPLMDHDYCYSPKVYLPFNGPLSHMSVNKENGEFGDTSTSDKKEEKRNELYMGKYKIKKRNHHHRHHHRHHRHGHQNGSEAIQDARLMSNTNLPILTSKVQQELDETFQKAREEFQKRFGKLEVPSIPEKKTLRIQSLNEPPMTNLKKKNENSNKPMSPDCSIKENSKPNANVCGNTKEINQTKESKINSLPGNEEHVQFTEVKEIKREPEVNIIRPPEVNRIRQPEVNIIRESEVKEIEESEVNNIKKSEVIRKSEIKEENNVNDRKQSVHTAIVAEQERPVPAINTRDQNNQKDENLEFQCSHKEKQFCMTNVMDEKISEIPESVRSEDNGTNEQEEQAAAAIHQNSESKPAEITVNVDVRDGLHVELSGVDMVVDRVNQLKEDIVSLIKEREKQDALKTKEHPVTADGCKQVRGENTDDHPATADARTANSPKTEDEDDSGEVKSSDENENKSNDRQEGWRERSYSPYRRVRSRTSSRQWSLSRSRSRSFTRCRSRSHSYERSRSRSQRSRSWRSRSRRSKSRRSRSRSTSYRSRSRKENRIRRRYRRSSHSSCSTSSRSSSRGSPHRISRSCSTCPSRSRSHSRKRSRHNRSRSMSRSRSRSSSSRRKSSGRGRRYLRDRSVSRERRLEIKNRQEKEWEDRRVLYIGNIKDGTTRRDINSRFSKFGNITRITLHFREQGDNYCFVTFAYTCDAYAAVEFGNEDPSDTKYELCFGGRRNFCRTSYADLDNMHKEEDELKYGYDGPAAPSRKGSSTKETDFDALLKQALKKVKHR